MEQQPKKLISTPSLLNDSTDRIDVAPIQKKTVKILQDEKSDV